ncbi:MAG: hypothetical protein J7J06_05860 [Methanosarcinales archaeon]|nr:hypothetical protein [Methanosarcinales archaeon]
MYEKDSKKHNILQGDIFQRFNYVRWAELIGENIEIDEIEIPFFVVLTQSCDLWWDFEDRNKSENEKRDKYIQSILVCPAYIADLVKSGEHLEGVGLIMEKYNSKRWDIIKRNNNERYHFLERNEELGMPDLVIDFKQYYTIPTYILYILYKSHFIGSLKPLFRENLSHRFAFYLSRIGLPDGILQ